MDISNCVEAAESIARAAGKKLLHYLGKEMQIEAKTYYWDLVTEADTAAERIIIEALNEQYPDHNILSEEAGFVKKTESKYTWVVDPLDGTTNFSHQFPMFAVSIALHSEHDLLAGAVFNPAHEEMFKAGKGLGAFLNDKPMQVSQNAHLNNSLLATGFAYDRLATPDNNYAEFCRMTNMTQGVRRLGSAALDLSYVAAGRLDGYWERGLKIWDIAAGALLVTEAGGRVTDYAGNPIDPFSGRIVASNAPLHHTLLIELNRFTT